MKTNTLFLLFLLLFCLSSQLLAQQTWALKPYAVTLPRLTTAQQSTSAPQQAGNVVYNTDEQKMALHNGTNWQYISTNAPEASQFQNQKAVFSNQLWAVPASVTRILVEVWGGGQGGDAYHFFNYGLYGRGGNAGAYARGFMAVTPGTNLTLTVGAGDPGALPGYSSGDGGSTSVKNAASSITADGGCNNGLNSATYFLYGNAVGFGVGGGRGTGVTIAYGQQSSTGYVLLVKCGDGGTAYGALPGGTGEQFASLNSSSLLYTTGGPNDGSFPGGGGGAGYSRGGDGAPGMIVLHW